MQTTQAPFPARPDTVVPGDLRGPFDGRVLDAESGKPVEGATIEAAWAFEEGRGLQGPSGQDSKLVESDADGRYRIAAIDGTDDARQRIARFTLIVYKRGYIAYRSDRRFEDLSARHDFAQTGNVVQLKKLPAEMSHAKHLAFVGAGGPMLTRLAWELPLAAQEMAPPPPKPEEKVEEKPPVEEEKPEEKEEAKPEVPPAPPLDATVLLTRPELRVATRFRGSFLVGKLADLPTSPSYDSMHFKAVKKPESFDAAVRVFKVTPEEAEQQFGVLARELPKAKRGREVGTASLRAIEGNIFAVATLDKPHGVVLLFTCGKGLCKNFPTAVAIVKKMATRFDLLGKAAPAAPAAPSAPVPEKSEEKPAEPTPPTETPSTPNNDYRLRLKPPEFKR